MKVDRLKATNFRNLEDITFLPCPGVNVLCGDNAQGKTNLIEAIWLFSGTRSFRGSKDAEFISFGKPFCRLELDFCGRGLHNNASLAISDTKKAMLGGIKLNSAAGFSGNFCSVVFSPEHLELVKSGPLLRRRFIDSAITEIIPRHETALSEYRELLHQRNALLKDLSNHSELLDTLEVWDEKLVQIGARIVFTRLRYLKRLSEKAKQIYNGIAEKPGSEVSGEHLTIDYAAALIEYPQNLENSHEAILQISKKLADCLKSQRSYEIDQGCTRVGPHRDDIEIKIGEKPARLFASQGQQRSAVLALKLAEAQVLTETIGESPVLLLDDVMSELDRFRQNYILNHIGDCQVFITCCDPAGLENLSGGSVFNVKSGKIEQRKI